MTEHADQLREAFETHENQTPDPAAVYARVQELSRRYQRRRKGAVVAGGAFLGVGLIAGATQLPGILAGSGDAPSPIYAAGPAPASPSALVLPSFTKKEMDQYWAAYAAAGYDYDDAMRLARLWKVDPDRTDLIKAEAGKLILSGQRLPFPSTPDPTGPTTAPTYSDADLEAAHQFYAAGYTYADAVELADLWKLTDIYQAKIRGGEMLQHGRRLPIKPDPRNVAEAKQATYAEAFLDKGYDYEDAQKLAELWHLKSPYDAKVAAGKRILAGQSLPIKP